MSFSRKLTCPGAEPDSRSAPRNGIRDLILRVGARDKATDDRRELEAGERRRGRSGKCRRKVCVVVVVDAAARFRGGRIGSPPLYSPPPPMLGGIRGGSRDARARQRWTQRNRRGREGLPAQQLSRLHFYFSIVLKVVKTTESSRRFLLSFSLFFRAALAFIFPPANLFSEGKKRRGAAPEKEQEGPSVRKLFRSLSLSLAAMSSEWSNLLSSLAELGIGGGGDGGEEGAAAAVGVSGASSLALFPSAAAAAPFMSIDPSSFGRSMPRTSPSHLAPFFDLGSFQGAELVRVVSLLSRESRGRAQRGGARRS